jgi:hypothetical protein
MKQLPDNSRLSVVVVTEFVSQLGLNCWPFIAWIVSATVEFSTELVLLAAGVLSLIPFVIDNCNHNQNNLNYMITS